MQGRGARASLWLCCSICMAMSRPVCLVHDPEVMCMRIGKLRSPQDFALVGLRTAKSAAYPSSCCPTRVRKLTQAAIAVSGARAAVPLVLGCRPEGYGCVREYVSKSVFLSTMNGQRTASRPSRSEYIIDGIETDQASQAGQG